MDIDLGTLSKVDVRKKWHNEAKDFTPWLARPENMEMLSNAIGIELEVEETEVAVGPYSADILAKDTATGDYVVIENQLAKTNHDHLGKAITYASVLDATAVIWISTEFTEEHKKALDWLNNNISEDISFLGIQIELWKIDKSNPALKFNIVSKPANFARKSAITKASSELTESRKLQLEWWTAFSKDLIAKKVVTSTGKPHAYYWFNVPLGRSGIYLNNTANTYDNKIGVRVYLRDIYNGSTALMLLLEQKDEIEKEIGHKLIWDNNPEARDKTIIIYKSADLNKRDNWKEYLDWMTDMTGRFVKTFSPRVKKLDLNKKNEDDNMMED